jgi:hypothetical protein
MTETITISVSEDTAQEFRRLALHKYGKRKGALEKVMTDAIRALAEKSDYDPDALALLKKGLKMGKITGTREDWHER